MIPLRIIHRHAVGTTLTGAGAGAGRGIAAVLHAQGWRYSPHDHRWYVPRSRDRAPRRELIARTEAELARMGYAATVELHVSPRPVEDLGITEGERNAPPQDVARRIEDLQRRLRTIRRELDGYRSHLGVDFPSAIGPEREDLIDEKEHLSTLLQYWQEVRQVQLDQGLAPRLDRKSVSPGDLVQYRGKWVRVVRANRVSVSLHGTAGGTWIETAPYHQLTGHRPQDR